MPAQLQAMPAQLQAMPAQLQAMPARLQDMPAENVVPPRTIWKRRTTSDHLDTSYHLVPIGSYQSHKKRTRTRFL